MNARSRLLRQWHPFAQFLIVGVTAPVAWGESPSKIAQWEQPLRGGVYGGYYDVGVDDDLRVAKAYGFNVVRVFFPGANDEQNTLKMPGAMTPSDLMDWDSKYFQTDQFEAALKNLEATVASAERARLRVILSAGPVPGSHGRGPVRWRLYRRQHWHDKFADYWARVARRFASNPTVIGYVLLNEPGFEITQDLDFADESSVRAYYEKSRGTAADLNALYPRVVAAIRRVDHDTPIIVQPGQYGRPQALQFLRPLDDDKVIYCFHWYGPWLYTTHRMNRDRWSYPGPAPSHLVGDADKPGQLLHWDIDRLRSTMAAPILTWQKRHAIPSSRIYVGEFGVDRRVKGMDRWLTDMLTIIEENRWHWTYYMFREREWDAMDYELGPLADTTTRSSETPGMRVIRAALRGNRGGD